VVQDQAAVPGQIGWVSPSQRHLIDPQLQESDVSGQSLPSSGIAPGQVAVQLHVGIAAAPPQSQLAPS